MIDSRCPYSVASLAERWTCSGSTVRNLIKAEARKLHGRGVRLVRCSAANTRQLQPRRKWFSVRLYGNAGSQHHPPNALHSFSPPYRVVYANG